MTSFNYDGVYSLAGEVCHLLPELAVWEPLLGLGLHDTLALRMAEHFGVPCPAARVREDIGFAGVVIVMAEVLEALGRRDEGLSAIASRLALSYDYGPLWHQIKDLAVQDALLWEAHRVGMKPHGV